MGTNKPEKFEVRRIIAALAILLWIFLASPTPARAQSVGGACSVASGSIVLSNGLLLVCNGSTWALGESFSSGGNVGIGTATPGVPLEVYSTASGIQAITGYVTSTGSNAVQGYNSGSGATGYLGAGNGQGVIGNGSSSQWGGSFSGGYGVTASNTAGYWTQLDNSSWGVNTNGNISLASCLTIGWGGYCGYNFNDAGNAYFGGAIYIASPIYDANNGGYYVQPSSTSVFNNIYVYGYLYNQGMQNYDGDWLVCMHGDALFYSATCGRVSDARAKTNIVDLPETEGLAAIMQLRPVAYNWKDAAKDKREGRQVGLLAQEVKTVLPELVLTGGDSGYTLADGTKHTIHDTMSVSYDRFTAVLTKGIQELFVKWSDDHDALVRLRADDDNLRAQMKAANDNRAAEIAELRQEIAELKAARQ